MKRLLKPTKPTTEQGRAAVFGRIVLAGTDGLSGAGVAVETQKRSRSSQPCPDFFFFACRAFRAFQTTTRRFKVWSVHKCPSTPPIRPLCHARAAVASSRQSLHFPVTQQMFESLTCGTSTALPSPNAINPSSCQDQTNNQPFWLLLLTRTCGIRIPTITLCLCLAHSALKLPYDGNPETKPAIGNTSQVPSVGKVLSRCYQGAKSCNADPLVLPPLFPDLTSAGKLLHSLLFLVFFAQLLQWRISTAHRPSLKASSRFSTQTCTN